MRALAMTMAIGAAGFFPGVLFAADWPQFLGPERNGKSTETGLVDRLEPAAIKTIWRIPVGDGFSGPVVVGDNVLVFEQADGEATLRCLDVSDGSQRWKSGYPCRFIGGLAGGGPGPRATPVAVDGLVYVIGPEATLRCHRIDDGAVEWSRPLKEQFEIPAGFFGVSSTPLVEGVKIIVNVGGRKAGVAAIDRMTGRTLWTATEDEASYASPVAATVDGKRVVYVFARSGLHCLDSDGGAVRFFFPWRARINASVNAATPILTGQGNVFLTSSYNTGAALVQTLESDGKLLWSSQDALSSQYATPVFHEGFLYGIDGRADVGKADLVCIDATDGSRKWTVAGYGCASIIYCDGKLLLFTEDGKLELARANPERFESLGAVSAFDAGDCRAHPALAGGRVYLRGPDELVCIDLRK